MAKELKLDPKTRPSGGPGKSRNYRWEVWHGPKLVDSGECSSGQSDAEALAHEAADRIRDHYDETGEVKAVSRFKPGNFLR